MSHLRLATAWIAAAVLCFGVGTAAGADLLALEENNSATGQRNLSGKVTAFSTQKKVSNKEAEKWLRWVIPLPKRVQLEGKLTLPASDIALRSRKNATDVEQAALKELAMLLTEKTGRKRFDGGFVILIGVCDADGKIDGRPVPGARKLRGLKNADQAYVIAPLQDRGLAVAGLTERGVYHGVKTLQQLLQPYLAPGKVTLPITTILDWPDLAERGEWGGTAEYDAEYFADLKLNLIEAHCRLSLDDQGRGVAFIDAWRQEAARLHAVKWVPIITHLDNISYSRIYNCYPHLKGRGPRARHPSYEEVMAPCFSEPKMADILADWFVSLARKKGVKDINVWLTEHEVRCDCPKCKTTNQFVLEATACVRAWRLAREKVPGVRLRILLTQTSYRSNDKVLAVASDHEMGVTYYSGHLTYDSSRNEMIYPLLEDFARKGRWLGCYPQLTASWRIVCPWSGPQFIKFRMTEFVDKGLSCLCGYATPDNRFYDFNVTAAAEWSWNAHGRSEREFAAAWATRRGLADPDKAADWAVMLGPVGWDVYGSRIPMAAFSGPGFSGLAARMIQSRARPVLGHGLFRYFPTTEHIDADLAVCDKALKLAEELGDPAIIAETRTIRGYVRMVKSIHAIAGGVAGKKKLDDMERKSLQAAFDELARAGREVTDGLEAWKQVVAPDSTASRFAETVNITRGTVSAIAAALAPFGVKQTDP